MPEGFMIRKSMPNLLKIIGLKLFIIIPVLAFSQNPISKTFTILPDSLKVSNTSSIYLAFPKEVDLINIGSADFAFQVEKSMVYLKALKPGAKTTNLFLKCGQGLWVVNLVYQVHPSISLYDFRNINFDLLNKSHQVESGNKTVSKEEIKESFHPGKGEKGKTPNIDLSSNIDSLDTLGNPFGISISKIQNSPDRFKTFGTAENQITILLTNIFSDTKRMILKFKIINRSSLNYDLDYVSFQFRRKGHFSQNTVLSPLYSPKITSCGPKDKQTLVYILPLFGSSDRGEFSATFRELNGDRKETIDIPERAFKLAEIL